MAGRLNSPSDKNETKTMTICGREYWILHKEIGNTCKPAKIELLKENYAQIERLNTTDKADVQKNNRPNTRSKNMFINNMHKI